MYQSGLGDESGRCGCHRTDFCDGRQACRLTDKIAFGGRTFGRRLARCRRVPHDAVWRPGRFVAHGAGTPIRYRFYIGIGGFCQTEIALSATVSATRRVVSRLHRIDDFR